MSIKYNVNKITSEYTSLNLSWSLYERSGLQEINVAVNNMDQVTQQNAAMVEETTAAANLLNDEAGTLRDMVMRFNVARTGEAPHRRAA